MKPLGVLQNVSDGKNDEEYVTQYCGGLEDPRYEYEEGCDSIDIPYATEKCYCRTGTGWNIIFTLSDYYSHLRDISYALSTWNSRIWWITALATSRWSCTSVRGGK